MFRAGLFCAVLAVVLFTDCRQPLNHPFPDADPDAHRIGTGSQPETLDFVRAGDAPSIALISNAITTPYQYHYLKRPLTIEPLFARRLPEVSRAPVKLPDGKIIQVYRYRIYLHDNIEYPADACMKPGRKILPDDFIATIKRTANLQLSGFAQPVYSDLIIGFNEYSDYLDEVRKHGPVAHQAAQKDPLKNPYSKPMAGARAGPDYIDLFTPRKDRRILYAMAMHTSAPVPLECVSYYSAEGGLFKPVSEKTLDTHLIESGSYVIREWEVDRKIIFDKNPHNLNETFPDSKDPRFAGLSGHKLPLADSVFVYFVKSAPTLWTLFQQGYVDRIALDRDSMDQVIDGSVLKDNYEEKGIQLDISSELVTFGLVFNLRDKTLKNINLRKAIGCAIDKDTLIERFFPNRAVPAYGLIPPGLTGHTDEPGRKCGLKEAKEYMQKAGYSQNNRPVLTLSDVSRPQGASFIRFFIDSLAEAGIDVKADISDAPSYFRKRQSGQFQMATWGWGADYPDPQNFFQLFITANQKTGYNESHYSNPRFDRIYNSFITETSDEVRKLQIKQMNQILAEDVPVVFTFHRNRFGLSQPWMQPVMPHPIANNQFKYRSLDPDKRHEKLREWNSW